MAGRAQVAITGRQEAKPVMVAAGCHNCRAAIPGRWASLARYGTSHRQTALCSWGCHLHQNPGGGRVQCCRRSDPHRCERVRGVTAEIGDRVAEQLDDVLVAVGKGTGSLRETW